MQRLIIFAFLIFLLSNSFAQTDTSSPVRSDFNAVVSSGFSDPEIHRPFVIEQDENIFLCNWITDQTFAYWNEKTDMDTRRIVHLLSPGGTFCMPIYGQLWSLFKKGHNGLDIHLVTGDSVRAVFDGTVRYAQYNKGGFGNLVIVRHPNGLETYYAHFSKLLVAPNQKVKAGQVVGLGGTTGRSKGPHLHFEVRYRDMPLDPFSFIDYEKKQLKCTQLELCRKVFEPWNNEVKPVSTHSLKPKTNSPVVAEKKDTVTSTVRPAETEYYTVKQGDTLYSISVRYKTTVAVVCKLNGMKETDILSIGKKLRVR